MKQALGLIEINGLSTTVVAADTMVKAANIHILGIENTKGLGYMTMKIAGDVGAVDATVSAGKQIGATNNKLASQKVIPRSSDYVEQILCCLEPPVPPSSPMRETQGEIGTGRTGEMVRESSETAREPEPDGGQADSVREETDSKDEPQAETEQPSEEKDFKPAEKLRKVSRRISAAKGTGTARSKNS